MRIAEGQVVNGAIRTRAKLREGARVTVIEHDDRPPVKLSPAEEAAVLAGIGEIEEGKAEPVEKLRARVRRHRATKQRQ